MGLLDWFRSRSGTGRTDPGYQPLPPTDTGGRVDDDRDEDENGNGNGGGGNGGNGGGNGGGGNGGGGD